MSTIVVTGAAGFIGNHLVAALLDAGHTVMGLDNLSRPGAVVRSLAHPNMRFVTGDARDRGLLADLLLGADHLIAAAALVGGVGYTATRGFDVLAHNEQVSLSTTAAAVGARQLNGRLRKMTVISSQMAYGPAPSPLTEGDEQLCAPPALSYGFQKLAAERLVRAACEQHGLPFTIVRPFNPVGPGDPAGHGIVGSGHVVPELVRKVLSGADPLPILGDGTQLRAYTHVTDLAAGIVTTLDHSAAYNEDFNISTARPTTVRELAEVIWRKVKGPDVPLRLHHDPAYRADVAVRLPNVDKARRLLGFEATTSLEATLDDVIAEVRGSMSGAEAA